MWAEDKEIKTDEEWDKPWLRNYTYGFYAWPKKLQVKNVLNKKLACSMYKTKELYYLQT